MIMDSKPPLERPTDRCERCGCMYSAHIDGHGGTCGDFEICFHVRKKFVGEYDGGFVDEDGLIWRLTYNDDLQPRGWFHAGPGPR